MRKLYRAKGRIIVPKQLIDELKQIQGRENEYSGHYCDEKLHALWRWGFPLPGELSRYDGFSEPRVPYTITFYDPDELMIIVDGRDYTFRLGVASDRYNKEKRKRVTKEVLRKVMKKAAYYRKRGMSRKQALKKAWRTVVRRAG